MTIYNAEVPGHEIIKLIRKGLEAEAEELTKKALENVKKQLEQRAPEIVAGIIVGITKMTQFEVIRNYLT